MSEEIIQAFEAALREFYQTHESNLRGIKNNTGMDGSYEDGRKVLRMLYDLALGGRPPVHAALSLISELDAESFPGLTALGEKLTEGMIEGIEEPVTSDAIALLQEHKEGVLAKLEKIGRGRDCGDGWKRG